MSFFAEVGVCFVILVALSGVWGVGFNGFNALSASSELGAEYCYGQFGSGNLVCVFEKEECGVYVFGLRAGGVFKKSYCGVRTDVEYVKANFSFSICQAYNKKGDYGNGSLWGRYMDCSNETHVCVLHGYMNKGYRITRCEAYQ